MSEATFRLRSDLASDEVSRGRPVSPDPKASETLDYE